MLDAAGAAARRSGQCAIIVDTDLLALIHGRLWVDSLFVALRRTSRTSSVDLILCGDQDRSAYGTPAAGSLWLTRSVLQGDTVTNPDVQSATGIAVYSSLAANGAVSCIHLGATLQAHECGIIVIDVGLFSSRLDLTMQLSTDLNTHMWERFRTSFSASDCPCFFCSEVDTHVHCPSAAGCHMCKPGAQNHIMNLESVQKVGPDNPSLHSAHITCVQPRSAVVARWATAISAGL